MRYVILASGVLFWIWFLGSIAEALWNKVKKSG